MRSHFHDWIDYNGVHFQKSYLIGVVHFWESAVKKIFLSRNLKKNKGVNSF